MLIRAAELELAPGLNAVTGETGAGKTIFAQAIGLLLGARADASSVGSDGTEAYVEAELDVPDGFFDEEDVAALGELRPEGEAGLVLARRVFGDGRTRAYAWGRAVAREDLATAAERLIAMSGQFEQRRLARPAFQLDVLDAFCGPEQLERRRETAQRLAGARRGSTPARGAESGRRRRRSAGSRSSRRSPRAPKGSGPGDEAELRAQRERMLHVAELGAGAQAAAAAVAPDDDEGAAALAARAERALAPLERLAPELAAAAADLRDVALRLREVGSDLHRFVASLEADPRLVEEIEAKLERIADLKRRFGCASYEELLERAESARRELDAAAAGRDPVVAAAEEVAGCGAASRRAR